MTDIPTPSDLSRDLAADLAICDNATPGPWRNTIRRESAKQVAKAITDNGDIGISQCSESVVNTPNTPTAANVICWMGPAAGGYTSPCRGGSDDIVDARFIATAREGWPATIRRAISAESLLQKLSDIASDMQEPAITLMDLIQVVDEARTLLRRTNA